MQVVRTDGGGLGGRQGQRGEEESSLSTAGGVSLDFRRA